MRSFFAAARSIPPQLLQLSGVGRAEDIQQHGVSMVHELAGVGENLQDHLDVILAYKTRDHDVFGLTPFAAPKMLSELWRWGRNGTGMMASNYG